MMAYGVRRSVMRGQERGGAGFRDDYDAIVGSTLVVMLTSTGPAGQALGTGPCILYQANQNMVSVILRKADFDHYSTVMKYTSKKTMLLIELINNSRPL
jgi:hypothetical protein